MLLFSMGKALNKYLSTAIERAGRTLDLCERVHIELDEGKEFSNIDNGLREDLREISYDRWFQYMEARLTGHVRDIVLTYRAYEKPEQPDTPPLEERIPNGLPKEMI